jgi:hypothetical protein
MKKQYSDENRQKQKEKTLKRKNERKGKNFKKQISW